ncbi:sensor histidine kinase [Dictyobacter arantiisoli]|uniref:histidine kinase n=1 Tax=Dictyobacter arantiisoli TaxID=2014874 RepID=A0A5A5T6G4_9CHLR|nr:HAMP domain-containing sensor histidine kinase [Dictyobacter arantiisoli]GCF06619.1 hypothetical protein KDI_01830 [Dictyobacter arantiisoli]
MSRDGNERLDVRQKQNMMLSVVQGKPAEMAIAHDLTTHYVALIRDVLSCHFVMLTEFCCETDKLVPLSHAGTSPLPDQYWEQGVRLDTLVADASQYAQLCSGEVFPWLTAQPASSISTAYQIIVPLAQQENLIGMLFISYNLPLPRYSLHELPFIKSSSQLALLIIQQERARREAERKLAILQDRLALLEAEQDQLCLSWLNLNPLIMAVVKRIRGATPHRHIALRLAVALPVLLGDREKLLLVISHLISTALEYSAPGSDIIICSRVAGNLVHLSIHTRSAVIALAVPKYDHSSLQMTDQSGDCRGIYLNLALEQKIINLHGGQIWVECSMHQTLTFHCTICFAASQSVQI